MRGRRRWTDARRDLLPGSSGPKFPCRTRLNATGTDSGGSTGTPNRCHPGIPADCRHTGAIPPTTTIRSIDSPPRRGVAEEIDWSSGFRCADVVVDRCRGSGSTFSATESSSTSARPCFSDLGLVETHAASPCWMASLYWLPPTEISRQKIDSVSLQDRHVRGRWRRR